MKILFVFYYPSGGVETLARQRSLALAPHGIQFHFLYYETGPGLQNITNETSFVTKANSEIRRILKKEKYDAIIVCTDSTFLKRLRNLQYKGILIFEVQGLGSFEQADKMLEFAVPNVTSHADAILFPKTPHLAHLINKFFPTVKKFSFHNMIDLSLFTYRKLEKNPHPIIGWVGRLEENKNWKDFLEIGSKMIKHNSDIRLWMFEDNTLSTPKERAEFEVRIQELNLSSNLSIHNNVPHYKMADYFSIIGDSGGFMCSTSKVEGFGYAVLEAMCCKCPVLSSNSDGVSSFVIHDQTGKIYAHGDIDSAVKSGLALMNDTFKTHHYINNGLNHIRANFSLDIYAQNFIGMLKQLGL